MTDELKLLEECLSYYQLIKLNNDEIIDFLLFAGKMNISEEVDLEDYVARPDKISGADINAICQEVSIILFLYNQNASLLITMSIFFYPKGFGFLSPKFCKYFTCHYIRMITRNWINEVTLFYLFNIVQFLSLLLKIARV